MTEKQSKTQQGKKRGVYKLHVNQNFGGRGAIRCGVCGEPITKHKTMDFCLGRKVKDE